jgi:hypothetical protein
MFVMQIVTLCRIDTMFDYRQLSGVHQTGGR